MNGKFLDWILGFVAASLFVYLLISTLYLLITLE